MWLLARTVEKDFSLFPVKTIGKVYRRWLRVLEVIKLDNGGNRFVESLQGKLTNNPIATEDEEDAAITLGNVKLLSIAKQNVPIFFSSNISFELDLVAILFLFFN